MFRRRLTAILWASLIALLFQGFMFLSGRYFPAVERPLKLSFSSYDVGYEVKNSKEIKVFPGGQSIGVLLHAQGAIVVGQSAVWSAEGKKCNPAMDAGVRLGDVIEKANGKPVKNIDQLREAIAGAGAGGQAVVLEVKRDRGLLIFKVEPVLCRETKRYRIGLLVKDNAAGVGTLTFYDPATKTFGALGHVITDFGSSRPIELADGRIVDASIQGIRFGKRGQPGEKIGFFQDGSQITGMVEKNTAVGIFGFLFKLPKNPLYSEPLLVAKVNQVHEGPAEMLTVLKGNRVERFNIEILKVSPGTRRDGKGLVVKVCDQDLLAQSGGIVQGMSGSPIIQDNRLVGAVTHVFVNDPTRGYGVLAEWMIEELDFKEEFKQKAG